MPGQILMTGVVFGAARQELAAAPDGSPLEWLAHGAYLFAGIDVPIDIFEVRLQGATATDRPGDSATAQRSVAAQDEITLGWRPAKGLPVPRDPDWRLERKLGEGGFGEVWLAIHETSHEPMAFKFCFNAARLRTLKREITLFRLLREALGDRPDIARLHDVQLEHPPYYLKLEYTAGGDLVAWAKARGGIETLSLEGRLELVAQVAEALSAAHSVGILHKDIKPANVMVEEKKDGTVQPKLTDFGVGQLIERGRLLDLGIQGSGFTTHPSTLMTDVSSRSGTRLYMAPELFAGKEPSIQSDVYALGVMLYQVVVGDLSRPLGQGWERDIADELLREDIAACVDGDPDRRLSSAGELARRLRTLEERRSDRQARLRAEEEMERQRRRQKVFITAAVAAVALAVFIGFFAWRESQLRAQAERSEAKAESARTDAEALVEFMLTDLHDELEPIGRLELLGDVAQRVLEYYKDLDLPNAKSETSLHKVAALRVLGDVLQKQGDVGAAQVAYEEALTIAREQAAHQPEDLEAQDEIVQLLNQLGYIIRAKGDWDGSIENHREALDILKALCLRDPDNMEWSAEMAVCYSKFGLIYSNKGEYSTALDYYMKAHAILEELVEREPKSTRWRRELSNSKNNVSSALCPLLGRSDEAIEMARAAVEISEQLSREEPDDFQRQRDLSVAIYYLGNALASQDSHEKALENFNRAASIRRRLVAHDPKNSLWLRDLGFCLNSIGVIARILDRHSEALEAHREGLTIFERLADLDPKNIQWLYFLEGAQNRLAESLHRAEKHEEELELRKARIDTCTRRLAIDPKNLNWQRDLEVANRDMAHQLTIMGRHDEAVEVLKDSVANTESILKIHPEDSGTIDSLYFSYERLAIEYREMGRHEEAVEYYRKSLALLQSLVNIRPHDRILVNNLAIVQRNLANELQNLGNNDEALEFGLACVDTRRRIVSLEPENLEYQGNLAYALGGLGEQLSNMDRFEEAVEALRECQTIYKSVIEREPEDLWAVIDTSRFTRELGLALRELGRHEEAVEVFRESMALAESAANINPEDKTALGMLPHYRYSFAWQLQKTGKIEQALDVIQSMVVDSRERIDELTPEDTKVVRDWSWILVRMGQLQMELGEEEGARQSWERAVEIIEPLTTGSDRVTTAAYVLDTHAQALLLLDRIEEARPIVEELLEQGWKNERFLIDCLEHGMLPWQANPVAAREQMLSEADSASSDTVGVDLPPLQPLSKALEDHWARMESKSKEKPPRVRFRGVVTAAPLRLISRGQFFVQDGNAGISIDDPTLLGVINQTLEAGMNIELVGTVVDYKGLPELKPDSPIRILGTREVPAPHRMQASEFNLRKAWTLVDGGQVKLHKPEYPVPGRAFDYLASDSNGTTFTLRVEAAARIHERFWADDNTCRARGILSRFGEDYLILPRSIADLE